MEGFEFLWVWKQRGRFTKSKTDLSSTCGFTTCYRGKRSRSVQDVTQWAERPHHCPPVCCWKITWLLFRAIQWLLCPCKLGRGLNSLPTLRVDGSVLIPRRERERERLSNRCISLALSGRGWFTNLTVYFDRTEDNCICSSSPILVARRQERSRSP